MPIIAGRSVSVRGLGFQGAGAPAQVTSLTATNVGSGRAFDNGRIDLAWSAPANNGAPIAGYFIERSTNSGSTWSTLVANTGNTNVSYSDTSLLSAQRYDYRVSAINAVGTGLASTAANATATTVPQAPTIGTATAGSGSASITFTAGATGGSSITGYTMTSSPGSITGTGASSPITVSGLTNGTAYTFTVTATNANGTSTASSASNSVTPEAYWVLTFAGAPGSTTVFNTGSGNFNTNLTLSNTNDTVRLNSSGTILSQNRFTLSSTSNIYVSAVDSSSNNYSSGLYRSGTTRYPLIYKLAPGGTISWQNLLNSGTTNPTNYIQAMALDSSGNPHVAFNPDSSTDPAIMKLDTNGNITWQRRYVTSANTYNLPSSMAIDSSGNIYVAGQHNGDQNSNANAGLTKFNSSGTFQWQKTYGPFQNGGSGVQNVRVVVGSSGAVYLAHQYNYYVVVLKLDSSGNISWQKSITGGIYNNQLTSVIIDSSENLYLGGWYTKDDPSGESWGYGWVLKMNSSGTMVWSRGISNGRANPNTQEAFVGHLSFAGSNSILVTGYARDSAGTAKQYVLKVPVDGTKTGTYTIDGISFNYSDLSSFKFILPNNPYTDSIWTFTPTVTTSTYTLSSAAGSISTPTNSRTIVNI